MHGEAGSVRFRAIWATQAAFGLEEIPAIWTRLVVMSMKKRTWYRTSPKRVKTSTVKKSAAAMAPQWAARKVFHGMVRPRSGAGTIPRPLRILLMVLRLRYPDWPGHP